MSEPKGDKISDAENNEGVVKTFLKGSATHSKKPEGICLAMTVLWIKGVLLANNVKYTGDEQLATGLQGFYQLGDAGKRWERRKKLFASQGLNMIDTGDQYFFGTCNDAFEWIRQRPLTVFSIKVPSHALAAFYQRPKVYYFDPNHGVYAYDTINEFCLEAYLHAYFDYCDWQAKPPEKEVFVMPIALAG